MNVFCETVPFCRLRFLYRVGLQVTVEEAAMLSSLERENGTVLGLPTLLRGGHVSYLGTVFDTRYEIGSGSLGWVSAILDPVLQQPRQVRAARMRV